MDRRTFLRTSGLLTLGLGAGCTSSDTTNTTTGRSTTRLTTTTTTTTTSMTSTMAETEPTEETSTTTTEDTPTAKERAATHLANANDHIGTAVTTYEETEGTKNATILTVDAASSDFNHSSVIGALSKATNELDEADQYATDSQQETLAQLRSVVTFLTKAALTQKHLIKAQVKLQAAATAFYDSDTDTFESESQAAQSRWNNASELVSSLREETTSGAMDATSHVSAQQYDQKLTQFDAEISTLTALDTRFGECTETLETFQEGVQHTVDGNDTAAWTDYGTAAYEFSKIQSSITDMTPADSFTATYSTLQCFVDAMAAGVAHMEVSANAGRDDDTRTKKAKKDAAKSDFESCEAAWGLDSVQRLFEVTITTTPDPASNVQVSFQVVQNTAVPGTIYDYEINNDNDYTVEVKIKGAWEWQNGDTPTKTETVTVGAYDILEDSIGTPAKSEYEALVSHNVWVVSISKV